MINNENWCFIPVQWLADSNSQFFGINFSIWRSTYTVAFKIL